jgi:BNR repeat-like domain
MNRFNMPKPHILTWPLLALGSLAALSQTNPPETDAPAASGNPSANLINIPTIDISTETDRQSIVDRDPHQYIGHPTSVLLEDGKTILMVYPLGHGAGPIQLKKSTDGGRTWSERLPTPKSWTTSVEGPMIFRTVGPDGTKHLLVFSGRQVSANDSGKSGTRIRLSVSNDDGETWSELTKIGDYGGIAAMASMIHLRNGDYMAFFHDDAIYWDRPDLKPKQQFRVFKVLSHDGGLSWSTPEVIASSDTLLLCEPAALFSPDGKQIAVILRENSRKAPSQIIFSDDDGKTWTSPRNLPLSLTGDRHVPRYAPDGRLFISFRDVVPHGPSYGDWVGWVGTYNDLVAGKEGEYRVRLMKNTAGVDCGYAGVQVLPDGTFVAVSYGHWADKQPPYDVCVRFSLNELDAKARAAATK